MSRHHQYINALNARLGLLVTARAPDASEAPTSFEILGVSREDVIWVSECSECGTTTTIDTPLPPLHEGDAAPACPCCGTAAEEWSRVARAPTVHFHHGPVDEARGVTNELLIGMILERLYAWQAEPSTRCRENAIMITKLEEVLLWGFFRARSTAMGPELAPNEHMGATANLSEIMTALREIYGDGVPALARDIPAWLRDPTPRARRVPAPEGTDS